jgi:nitroreductase
MNKIKQLIFKVIPGSWVGRLKLLRNSIKTSMFGLLSKSARLSALYFSVFSNAFINEQQATMYGIYSYYKNFRSKPGVRYLLRRNIHRLEKGLLMKPRHDVFAVDYITETLDCYEQEIQSCKDIEEPILNELAWAHDVQKEYFNTVAPHSIIDKARDRFEKLPPFTIENNCTPYKRDLQPKSPVDYDDLLALSRRRKSVRWYLQKKVPRDLLDKAITIASYSPSGCNRQPYEFRIYDDSDLIQKVSSLPDGTSGFYQNFPAIVVVVGELKAYYNEQDRHLIYIDSSLAAMSFMYALETLGLSSCGINWHDSGNRARKMSKLLGLKPDERVVMLISVGYPDPDGMVAYSQKKGLDLLRRFN